MLGKIVSLTAVAVVLAACGSAPAPSRAPLPLLTAPSPVSFDGNVAGQPTDTVFVLVQDANPSSPGVGMRAGESLRLDLPAAFRRNPSVAIDADSDTQLVLTKGWPQGAVRQAGQYRVGYDERRHSLVVTALQDLAIQGANAPGIKVIHLRGRSFVNPAAGDYPVAVTHTADSAAVLVQWQGRLTVTADAPTARLAPTNFHLPPGQNADFQTVPAGQVAAQPLAVLLWGAGGTALQGVGIAPRDLARFPRYTGGLLVQDTNHDRRLDPAVDKVVGGIIGAAPAGATGQATTSPIGPDGAPVRSGEILRNPAYPAAAGGGKPNAGLLPIQFKAGDKPGLYQPTIELIGGNRYQFTIQVPAP
ncbi:MAG: hypothetical protein NVS3B2_05810 [Ramlibacter sp.]